MSWIKNTYNQVGKLSANKKKQRQFAVLFLMLLTTVILYRYYKYTEVKPVYLSVFVVLALGYIFPFVVSPILFVWLFLGKLMGEITSFLVLFIIYFIVFSPITMINRLFKKERTNRLD